MHKITWIMVNTDFNIGNQLFTFMNSRKYYILLDKKNMSKYYGKLIP